MEQNNYPNEPEKEKEKKFQWNTLHWHYAAFISNVNNRLESDLKLVCHGTQGKIKTNMNRVNDATTMTNDVNLRLKIKTTTLQ